MNWKMNSREIYCKLAFEKGIVGTPMNTIMAGCLFSE